MLLAVRAALCVLVLALLAPFSRGEDPCMPRDCKVPDMTACETRHTVQELSNFWSEDCGVTLMVTTAPDCTRAEKPGRAVQEWYVVKTCSPIGTQLTSGDTIGVIIGTNHPTPWLVIILVVFAILILGWVLWNRRRRRTEAGIGKPT